VVVQSDGNILLAGDGHLDSGNRLLTMRFNANGARDLSYGPSGTGAVDTFLGQSAAASAMDLQADGPWG
jgi:hypothetical protein